MCLDVFGLNRTYMVCLTPPERVQMYVRGLVQMQILPERRTALYATWEVPGEMWSPRTKHLAELSQAERSEAAAEGGRRRRRPRASRGLQSQAGMRPN